MTLFFIARVKYLQMFVKKNFSKKGLTNGASGCIIISEIRNEVIKMTKFDKAKKKVERNKKLKKFSPYISIGNYKVFVLILPIFPFIVVWEKLKDWNYQRMKWDEKKAIKILNYVLPKTLEWDEEDNAFYYCLEWSPSGFSNSARIIDKKWCKKFKYDLRDFIEKEYENPNYIKTIERDWEESWVKFVEK